MDMTEILSKSNRRADLTLTALKKKGLNLTCYAIPSAIFKTCHLDVEINWTVLQEPNNIPIISQSELQDI